ncbi:hypothetical protein [Sulfurovum sp.]|uniref:TolB family protein n=1 Tax=Sulfurovum sp. TaxID=1969726 RepID=UPI0025DA063A|nr:hypothetical protein [Sulfurovum sp.]
MKIVLMMLVALWTLYAQTLPKMAFLGYDKKDWLVYVTQEDGTVKAIKLAQEPHSFDYNFKTGQILYIGSDGTLRLYHQGTERELKFPETTSSYIQPSFSCKKDLAYAVELINGNSKSTKIVSIDLKDDSLTTVVQQNSSQFEPSEINDQTLLFTNLVCNNGCGKLIQEIWQKDMIMGESNQLTLLNAFSNNPSVHPDGHWLFFSSNKNGNYHIWGKDLHTNDRSIPVTMGTTSDTFANAIGNGAFLYIRQNKSNFSIMYGDIKGKSYEIKLLKEYNKIRQLKVNSCK